jgi:hypothetical protein
MSRRRKGRPPDDPASLKTMRSAALQCLSCCQSLSNYARLGEEGWLAACKAGDVQTLISALDQAVEMGKGIEREPRLTLDPPCTFGNVTARNAHMAALTLGRRVKGRIEAAMFATDCLEAEGVRAVLYHLFGYEFDPHYDKLMPNLCDYGAWREAIESESDRAPRVVLQGTASGGTAAEKAKRDKLTDARDKWVYEQCCKGEAYDSISRQLPNKNAKWARISTKQGILDCARRYAERKGLPKPPPRQGR